MSGLRVLSLFVLNLYIFTMCSCFVSVFVCFMLVSSICVLACADSVFSVVISWFVIKVSKLSCVPRISFFVFFSESGSGENHLRGAPVWGE